MRGSARIAGLVLATSFAAAAAHAGPGLNGAYYDLGYGAGSVANALADIATLTPTATFTATTVCFPNCNQILNDGGSTISDFLGGNATDLSSDPITDLSGHVVVLSGELNIATDGSYGFLLGSDDGSQLFIDGSLDLSVDGDHPYSATSADLTLSAGQHAIEIVQYENGGVTGLTVEENGVGLGGDNISTSANASPVPEPASWALVLAGLGSVLRLRRRKLPA